MKRGKFLVATSLALVITLGMNMVSFAEEQETTAEENISTDVPYSLVHYSTEECHTGEEPYELTGMYITKDAVTLEKTGVSAFVDAKGILADGSIEDISRYAIWESSDTRVATAYQGRILAQSKGDAVITVKYGNYSASLLVTVEKTVDMARLVEQLALAYSYKNDERIDDLSGEENISTDVPYSLLHYSTEEFHTGEEPYELTGMYITEDAVTLEKTGVSKFVDAKGILADGSIEDISRYAIWESSDMEVAIADQGRILAQSKGDAIITVKYGNYSASFPVAVEKTIDTAQLVEQWSLGVYSYENDERIEDLSRAAGMINIAWTPSKNLTGWDGDDKNFKAGTNCVGVPYSQTPNQIGTAQEFASALSKADFYTVYTAANGVKMPRYGNDCSGFVSLSWNIGRYTTTSLKNGILSGKFPKVGSYNAVSPTVAELKTAYAALVPGDAVVLGGSHTFMIAYNDIENQKVQCYEQFPCYARVTEWTYTEMANAKYLPFSKK